MPDTEENNEIEIPKSSGNNILNSTKHQNAKKIVSSIVNNARKNVRSELIQIKDILSLGIASLLDEFMFKDAVETVLSLLSKRIKVDNYIKVHQDLDKGDNIPSSLKFKNLELTCKEETTMRNSEFQSLSNDAKSCIEKFGKEMTELFAKAKKLDIDTSIENLQEYFYLEYLLKFTGMKADFLFNSLEPSSKTKKSITDSGGIETIVSTAIMVVSGYIGDDTFPVAIHELNSLREKVCLHVNATDRFLKIEKKCAT